MARVRFVDVTKRYGDDGLEAISALNLDIADGEFVVLVGPSGSGKSTALRMLAGLEDISSGEVWIGDRVVNDLAPRDRDIAMVFQNYALYPHMSVRENMGFALRLEHKRTAEIDERVHEAAIALELDELLDRKPAQLSGGQRQRVAMGRAIVREPQAFLLDEPLSNLDAKLRLQTREEIAVLQRRLAVTTVYVTHDQTEALTLGDRIAVLRRGRLQQFGAPDELYLRPANVFVAGFIGSPTMNFVTGEAADGAIELPFGRLTLDERLRSALDAGGGRRVVVGLRPEDLNPVAPGLAGGLRFEVVVDTVESTGADLYAHARIDADVRDDPHLDALVADSEGAAPSRARDGVARLVARLDPATRIRPGSRVTLGVDADRIYLFDVASGAALAGARRDADAAIDAAAPRLAPALLA
jgi:multiple sugar transport system ATP-binding protein